MKPTILSLFSILTCLIPLWSQDFYDINTVNVIEITFEESNWDAILDTYYSNDNDEKLMGSAVINGVAYDSIGVKFKGNSTYSANNSKNPLHIYLDYMLDQDYDGYESIKLSNGKNDPSFVREVLSYEIARKYMIAPLSNYAKVYINDSFYGVFSSSEAINKDFMERRVYADKTNVRVKCNPENTSNGGSSLEYQGTDSSSYYSYYEMKSDMGWQDLIDLTYSLENTAANIETILDIDHAIWMLAFDNVVVNLDSYIGPFRQNYYLIQDDNHRFIPILWDLNESFGAFEQLSSGNTGGGPGGGGGRPGETTTSSLDELDPYLREDDDTYPLAKMIFDNDRYTKMYIAHCKTMLEENFSNDWYSTEAEVLQNIIASDVASDPNAIYSSYQFSGNLTGTQSSTVGITELMDSRAEFLESHVAFNYTAPTISNIVAPENPSPYTDVNITANIVNCNYVYLAYRHSKDEVFTKVEMYDDGAHNDGATNDGVYGATIDVDESNTHYYIYAENADAGIFSPQRAEHEYYNISAEASEVISSDVVINELMASNSTVAQDENGDEDDWIELYNNTNEPISLNGYYLSDDNDDIMQWAFPDTSIEANSYMIIWADKEEEQGSNHANFKLSSSGEGVYLSNSELTIVNAIEFGSQETDVSYARYLNGVGEFTYLSPTFASTNDNGTKASIAEDELLDIKLYPNPVSNCLNIACDNITNASIYNNIGQACNAPQTWNEGSCVIDMSSLPTGLYIVSFEAQNRTMHRSIIKR